jgi:type II secretory pathway component PulJ
MSRRNGFTFVEMLIAAALLATVGLAVFALLAGGLQIWERLQQQAAREIEVQLALEQMRRDLVHQRPFRPIGFEGSYDEVSFPALVPVTYRDRSSGKEWESQEIGQVAYRWDSLRQALVRSETPYRLLRRRSAREGARWVLAQLRRMQLSYGSAKADRPGVEWSSRWESPEPPLAVKIEVEYWDEATQRTRSQTVVVPIPIAQPQG